MTYSFDPLNDDGSPRRYVGLWKPPFEEFWQSKAPWALSYHLPQIRTQWMAGEGDKALYEVPS